MTHPLPAAIARASTPCKVCQRMAPLYGVVDFTKCCEEFRRAPLPLSGIPIYYYRCPQCLLLFTISFDHFTTEDFLAHIYNEEYVKVDPDYLESRPRTNAELIAHNFSAARNISILDYGGGNGVLASSLREKGFSDVATYDPFVPEFSKRPERRFDLVTCFEVLEHSTQPMRTFDELDELMKPDGVAIFSTLVQPADIDVVGLKWWYVAPRNGHVTMYTANTLQAILNRKGLRCSSFNPSQHVAWRTVPAFARHLFPK